MFGKFKKVKPVSAYVDKRGRLHKTADEAALEDLFADIEPLVCSSYGTYHGLNRYKLKMNAKKVHSLLSEYLKKRDGINE